MKTFKTNFQTNNIMSNKTNEFLKKPTVYFKNLCQILFILQNSLRLKKFINFTFKKNSKYFKVSNFLKCQNLFYNFSSFSNVKIISNFSQFIEGYYLDQSIQRSTSCSKFSSFVKVNFFKGQVFYTHSLTHSF